MEKKKSESSVQGEQARKKEKHTLSENINFSDIPESTDEELRRARKVGRPKGKHPVKQLIAIRIDPRLLKKIKKMALKKDKPYQTLVHEILEKALKRAA